MLGQKNEKMKEGRIEQVFIYMVHDVYDMPGFALNFFNILLRRRLQIKQNYKKIPKKSTKRHGEANAETERSRREKRVFKTKNVIKYHSTVIDNIINRRLYGTIYVVSISSNKHQNTHLFTKFLATFWTKISKLRFNEKHEALRGNTNKKKYLGC